MKNSSNNNIYRILNFFKKLSQKIAGKFELINLSKYIIENITSIFEASWGSILVYDSLKNIYYPLFSNKHPSKDKSLNNLILEKSSYIYQAVTQKKAVYFDINNTSINTNSHNKFILRYKQIAGSFCIIPLFYNKKHLGILCLNRLPSQNKFTKTEIRILQIFSSVISVLLHKHLYLSELKKLQDYVSFFKKLSEKLLISNNYQRALESALRIILKEFQLKRVAIIQIHTSYNKNQKYNFIGHKNNYDFENFEIISSVNFKKSKIQRVIRLLWKNILETINNNKNSKFLLENIIDKSNHFHIINNEIFYFMPIKNKLKLPKLLIFTIPKALYTKNKENINVTYSEQQVAMLSLATKYLSATIERYELLTKLAEEQTLLLEYSLQNSIFLDISLDLASTLDPVNILRKTFDRFIEIIDYTTISILLYDELEKSYQLVIQPAYKLPKKYIAYVKNNIIKLFSEYPAIVDISSQKDIITEVLHPQLTKKVNIKNNLNLQTLHLPFIVDQKIIGMLHLTRHTKNPFSSKELLTTSQFTGIFITSIKNAFIHRKTEKLAYTDPLTGLYNHRFFQESLEDEFLRSKRYNKPLSLIIIDIDFFKKFNDTYGHTFGDKVLLHCANIFKSSVREKIDVVARYGGEEFAIILPETKLEGAISLAERIRTSIETTQLEVENDSRKIRITISLGVASTSCTKISSKMELVVAADNALYKAKSNGRNRTEAYTSSEVVNGER